MGFESFAPPPAPVVLNAQAVSGILGSISIACWVIVFAPQIYENFYRKSAEGLSLLFVVLWLIGDVFNVIGSIAQNVLPTMLVLAIYYTLADIVLLIQCLLYGTNENVDPIHLSPANPLSDDILDEIVSPTSDIETERLLPITTSTTSSPEFVDSRGKPASYSPTSTSGFDNVKPIPRKDLWKQKLYNLVLVSLVLISGVVGWYISYIRNSKHDANTPPDHNHDNDEDMEIDPWGQFFGYLCAIFYLGSRVPQILLNYKRKSCDGISFMFFFFACMGNLTYVLSILSIGVSMRYLIINMSWLLGSVGTLFLDVVIFVQFFLYNEELDYETIDDQVEYP